MRIEKKFYNLIRKVIILKEEMEALKQMGVSDSEGKLFSFYNRIKDDLDCFNRNCNDLYFKKEDSDIKLKITYPIRESVGFPESIIFVNNLNIDIYNSFRSFKKNILKKVYEEHRINIEILEDKVEGFKLICYRKTLKKLSKKSII